MGPPRMTEVTQVEEFSRQEEGQGSMQKSPEATGYVESLQLAV